MAWDDGGNDYYTGAQLNDFKKQLAEKQAQLKTTQSTPKSTGKFSDLGVALNNKSIEQEIAQLNSQIAGTDVKNADGSAVKKRFQGITNTDGTLKSQYVLGNWNEVAPDHQALGKFRETALRDAGTASPWAKLALAKQQQEQMQAMDQAGQMQASGYNQALSNLAQTGGLSGAARERMARSSMNNGLLQRQQALRSGQTDRMNIGLQDEQQRMTQLGQLQGMENQMADIRFKNQEKQLGIDQFNMQNRLGEVDKRRSWDLDTWKTDMQTWGANKTADAQAKAARSGGKK